LDVPPKMKVKGYMYPQMKKPVGILMQILKPMMPILFGYIVGFFSCFSEIKE
jgi:hypothetical protein